MKVCARCGDEIYTRDGENFCPSCQNMEDVRKKKRSKELRKARHEALTSLGLVRVRGAMGGIYYE